MEVKLTAEQWAEVDEKIRNNPSPLEAVKVLRRYSNASLFGALIIISDRKVFLREQFPGDFPPPKTYRIVDLIEQVANPAQLVAIQALWDGDTQGWFLALSPVFGSQKIPFLSFPTLLHPDDEQELLGDEKAGMYGENKIARLGEKLASHFNVPFYFPSPSHPEDDCPSWHERNSGAPCRRCGILLLQRDPCPWKGVCYNCHLQEAKEKKGNWVVHT